MFKVDSSMSKIKDRRVNFRNSEIKWLSDIRMIASTMHMRNTQHRTPFIFLESGQCILKEQQREKMYLRPYIITICPLLRTLGSLAFHRAPSEDSDQTARMRSLIRVIARRTCSFVHFLAL